MDCHPSGQSGGSGGECVEKSSKGRRGSLTSVIPTSIQRICESGTPSSLARDLHPVAAPPYYLLSLFQGNQTGGRPAIRLSSDVAVLVRWSSTVAFAWRGWTNCSPCFVFLFFATWHRTSMEEAEEKPWTTLIEGCHNMMACIPLIGV